MMCGTHMSGCVDGKVEGVVGDLERENRGSIGVTNALWRNFF